MASDETGFLIKKQSDSWSYWNEVRVNRNFLHSDQSKILLRISVYVGKMELFREGLTCTVLTIKINNKIQKKQGSTWKKIPTRKFQIHSYR